MSAVKLRTGQLVNVAASFLRRIDGWRDPERRLTYSTLDNWYEGVAGREARAIPMKDCYAVVYVINLRPDQLAVPPAHADVQDALTWLHMQPDAEMWGAYYIANDGGSDLDEIYCKECATVLADGRHMETDQRHWATEHWGANDGVERCFNEACQRSLDTDLTDYGVDQALALQCDRPLECPVDTSELLLAARAMGENDPRWVTWLAHFTKKWSSHRSVVPRPAPALMRDPVSRLPILGAS